MNYNTEKTKRARILLAVLLGAVILGGIVFKACCDANAEAAEAKLVKVWIMCKPGSQVNVRRVPSKTGMEVGWLDCGDWFMTDGKSADGWIRCYGIGEYGEGWVWCGYVATEEPRMIGERYVCASNARVACRKWMDGPRVDGKCWLTNGSTVEVFCMADGWACTSRGYIRSEWLEADPR